MTIQRATQSRLDQLKYHVLCFLVMGWSCLWNRRDVGLVFSPQACTLLFYGGLCYTVGLVPWKMIWLEFHLPIWHSFVIAGTACFFAVVYTEIATLHELPMSIY